MELICFYFLHYINYIYIYIEENLYDIELTSSLYRDCIVGFSDFVEHYSILLPKIWKEKSML